jgi:dihydrodipicolinate synthase/N-acetylneuraminate lyase
MTDWPRAMPALVTPFDDGGDLDLEAHRHNVATMAHRGARGVVIGGSTGQGPYLESGERHSLTRSAREATSDAVVVCGVFAQSVRQAEAQIAEAADGGADAVLVATPATLVRSRPGGIEAFFDALSATTPLPILLYTVPQVTGVELPTASVAALARHPAVFGIKDSGGDATRFGAWHDAVGDDFVGYVGASRAVLDAHRNGAHGAITASANYALSDVSLAVRGDGEAQRRLTAISATVESHGVPGTMFAASLTGLRVGVPRKPLGRLDEAAAREITEALEARSLTSHQPRASG